MNLQIFKEKKFEKIIASMADYLTVMVEEHPDEDCRYTQEHIDECGKVLDGYIDELVALNGNTSSDKILTCVKNVVIALNELNVKTGYSLIETDQREYLYDFIVKVAVEAGLHSHQMI